MGKREIPNKPAILEDLRLEYLKATENERKVNLSAFASKHQIAVATVFRWLAQIKLKEQAPKAVVSQP